MFLIAQINPATPNATARVTYIANAIIGHVDEATKRHDTTVYGHHASGDTIAAGRNAKGRII